MPDTTPSCPVFPALERLRAAHAQAAEIVLLRCFYYMSMDEIADRLGVTTGTVKREWAFARTWLEGDLGVH